jgi:hypothetical protein
MRLYAYALLPHMSVARLAGETDVFAVSAQAKRRCGATPSFYGSMQVGPARYGSLVAAGMLAKHWENTTSNCFWV